MPAFYLPTYLKIEEHFQIAKYTIHTIRGQYNTLVWFQMSTQDILSFP